MKMLILIVLSFSLEGPSPMALEAVRNNYLLAPTDKKLCRDMIKQLDYSQDPLYMAYLGAFKAIWARHIFNPIAKLETFNKGKQQIEKAILLDPDNTEIRLIRLSVQANAPRILGYSSNIDEDRRYILAGREGLNSESLQKMVNELLK